MRRREQVLARRRVVPRRHGCSVRSRSASHHRHLSRRRLSRRRRKGSRHAARIPVERASKRRAETETLVSLTCIMKE